MSENLALTEAVYYILLSLCSPQHGYGIMQQVERMSAGRVHLAAGTLYGALSNLCAKGWIRAVGGEEGSRKKEYIITPEGKQILMAEWWRLAQLVQNGTEILGGNDHE